MTWILSTSSSLLGCIFIESAYHIPYYVASRQLLYFVWMTTKIENSASYKSVVRSGSEVFSDSLFKIGFPINCAQKLSLALLEKISLKTWWAWRLSSLEPTNIFTNFVNRNFK